MQLKRFLFSILAMISISYSSIVLSDDTVSEVAQQVENKKEERVSIDASKIPEIASYIESNNAESSTSDYVQRLMTNPENPETMQSATSTTQLAMTVAGLFAVIGMIFVVAWLVRRLSGGQFGQSNAVIKILATQPLGTKERICLIDVGGQQVLVGMTAQSMQTLMVLEQPLDLKSEKQGAAWSSSESVNSVFGAKLQQLLKGTPVNEVKKSSLDD